MGLLNTLQEEVLGQPGLGQQARPAALHHAAQGPAAHPHVKKSKARNSKPKVTVE